MLRRSSCLSLCAASFIILFSASLSIAGTPQINTGLSWLTSAQTSTGNWPEVDTSEYYSTAAALDAVYALEPSSPAYTTAFQWMTGQMVSPTDYLSRRIIALKRAGMDVSSELDGLLLYRNSNGGWGGETSYLSDNLDTALALQALKAANYPDLSVSNTALAYLTNSQNTDGGWGFYKDNSSRIYMTAIVSATLQQFPQTTTLATAITKATAYLSSHQNTDGGFGYPASTVYETALAYSALVGITADAMVLGNALNYITTTQSSNGSWNDDPYSTALALKALYLSEHIPASPPPAATTGSVMGTIVDATTNTLLSGVSIQLTGDPSYTATSNASGMFALSGIPVGSQQITLSLAGYSPLTVTASISAGTFINLGKVGMSVNPISGTVMGIVWNADNNTPFAGVTVQATLGIYTFQAISAADGSYKITGVNPGTITVGTPAGPAGDVYWNVPITGDLAAGGVLIYNPMMSKTPPAFVNVFAQTDKAIYRKGDTAGVSITVRNNRSVGYPVTLKVRVSDPSGASVYDTSADLNLIAKSPTVQSLNFALPANPQRGFYTILAEVYDGSATKLGDVSTNFGIFTSQISVTPVLPAAFTTGANTVTFNLVNTGTYAVSSGALNVILTDPDGQVISSATQSFSLRTSDTKTLAYDPSLPAIKFGAYTLTYTQSDETTSGLATTIQLLNTVNISPVFDKTSYKIRETANLVTNLSNTGNFSQDSMTMTVAVPEANFTQTITLSPSPQPSPAGGEGAGSVQIPVSFAIPETMTAGQHTATITLTLLSGSTTVQNTQFTIPKSALSLSLDQTAYTAGGTISPVISNTGGIDTTVLYTLSLFDSQSKLISEQSNSQAIQAGASFALALNIPVGAADGSYSLIENYKDAMTGKNDIVTLPLTITGVKATLAVQTDKQSYLMSENITGLSALTNTGTALDNGNLHLQVSMTAGERKTKTWTSQYDFQQGVRDGVDTYGVNDWLIPSDDFDNASLDPNKWHSSGDISFQSGSIYLNASKTWTGLNSRWTFIGDFDAQVDFLANNSSSGKGAGFTTYYYDEDQWALFIKNTSSYGYEAYIGAYQIWTQMAYAGSSTYSKSGKYRLVRSGNTITTYYWKNNSWTQLYTRTNPLYSGKALIELGINVPANTGFDNFRVNSGRIITANETSDSVRLLPISDNFDDGTFNNDRWSIRSAGSVTTIESNGVLLTQDTQTGVQSYSNVAGRFPLTGDFDIAVDWKTPIAPSSGNWNAVFQISDVDQNTVPDNNLTGNALQIKRAYTDGIGHAYDTGHYDGTQWDQWGGPIPTSDVSGSFRIKRTGPDVTVWYWNSSLSRWEWNGDTAGHTWNNLWTTPAYVQIGLQTDAPNSPAARAEWNNFTIRNNKKYVATGTINLKQDAGQSTNWQTLTWNSTQPIGTSIEFRTRTAATEEGLASASWSDYLTASGSAITSLRGRWIEIEAMLATADASASPLLNDVTVTYGNNPGDALWQADVPVNLAQGLISNLTNAIGTLDVPGKLYLQGTLTSSTGQTIATSEYPFYVIQGNTILSFSTDKKIYKPGEMVTITGEVRNLASITASVLGIQLTAGNQVLYTALVDVPANESYLFTTTTTAGPVGVYSLAGTVTQNGSNLAEIADQYEVGSPSVTATLTAPDTAGNDPFTVTLTLTNTGKTEASTECGVRGANLDALENIIVLSGETKLFQYSQQITSTMTYTATCTGDLSQMITKTVEYSGSLDASISVALVTDKISYNANEQATITSVITNQSGELDHENLTTKITITGSGIQGPGSGNIFTETKTITTLMPGAAFTFKTYWNTGAYASGTYPVTLEVMDASGAVLATGAQNLVITNVVTPGAALRGQISLDKQSIMSGEPVNISYSVTNVGNADLPAVTFTVQTVHVANQTVYDNLSSQATLSMGGVQSSTAGLDTAGYSAMDYLVVLKANIDGVEETLAGTYFRVEGAPTAPALISPAMGSDVDTVTPALTVSNASDPNDDKITYEFELYSDSGLSTLIVSSGLISQGTGTTAWTAPFDLTENATCYWRARAYDGKLYGPWMDPASFRVNTVNEPPTAPAPLSPADTTSVSVLTPILTVTNASDPDSTNLTYNFQVALDPDFTQIVAPTIGVFEGQGTTSWQVLLALSENTWYYWRAQADDWQIEGPWSATATFFVNTTNDKPAKPVILSPAGNAVVTGLSADIVLENSIDIDSPVISYSFEVDTDPAFNSASVIRSGVIPPGPGTTSWQATGLLDNTLYFVRAMAIDDGSAESGWTDAVEFFVNTANDKPIQPVIANPSIGAEVNVLTPTLTIHNATDPDRDQLTYDFEAYSDSAFTNLVALVTGIAETTSTTSWTVTMELLENQTYYWRCRAFDGSLYSDWAEAWFVVNKANDAPEAPALYSPLDGVTIATFLPTLSVTNALDPDSDALTYEFEVSNGATAVWSGTGVPQDPSGTTSVSVSTALADNTTYQWKARAFDGDRYGPWMNMAAFTVHVQQAGINVEIEVEPETLNQTSHGNWVMVEIELPHGYHASEVDLSSIRLEGVVPAETRPYGRNKHHHDHGCEHDRAQHDHDELKVKFDRNSVIAVLPNGDHVPVHVTGRIGSAAFEGVDFIRVIH